MLNLNTKEKSLLEDAKEHETLCVAKYKDHAEKTNCQELKPNSSTYKPKREPRSRKLAKYTIWI